MKIKQSQRTVTATAGDGFSKRLYTVSGNGCVAIVMTTPIGNRERKSTIKMTTRRRRDDDAKAPLSPRPIDIASLLVLALDVDAVAVVAGVAVVATCAAMTPADVDLQCNNINVSRAWITSNTS